MNAPKDIQAGCRPIKFLVKDGDSPAELTKALSVSVKEVFGTSPTVVAESRYIVCGDYTNLGDHEITIGVVVSGRSTGRFVDLMPGKGHFEVWTTVEQTGVQTTQLGLLVGTPADRESGCIAFIEMLE